MRIALLISGRGARYEVGLLRMLEGTEHEIDLFMALNGEECEYYEIMKKRLSRWLCGISIKPFELCDEFCEVYRPELHRNTKQEVKGKLVPYKVMSMYYHDGVAYEMAVRYGEEKGIRYETYMKYRSDMLGGVIPSDIGTTPGVLYSNKLLCQVNDWISDAWAWGDKDVMRVYCSTYEYAVRRNADSSGSYYISFEDTLTDNIRESGLPVERPSYPYGLDVNRRIFDPYPNLLSGWRGCEASLDIRKVPTLDHIAGLNQ